MAILNNDYATEAYCLYPYCAPVGYTAVHTSVTTYGVGFTLIPVSVRLSAYNITNLRILWEIESDGITTNNFTASSEMSTDKGVVNLKSDIVEKYWESTGVAAEWFQWDTGANLTMAIDTLALIDHNLSSSAIVTVKGYGTGAEAAPGSWAAVDIYATLEMSTDPTQTKLIWISPNLPTDEYRHWRVDIVDPTNSESSLRIGRFLAGSALVFNGENCLDEVDQMENNFKDEQSLTAFSRIANNRALKNSLTIRFRNLNRVSQFNYRALKRYMTYCRDTLKALVIIDPSTEDSKYEFTVFAKLDRMPRQVTKYIDEDNSYTTLDLELNEGR